MGYTAAMRQILVCIILLMVLAGALYFLAPYIHTPGNAPAVTATIGTGVSITTERINESTTTYTVSASYPQFGIPAIDAQIKADVQNAVTEFEALPPNPPDSATPQNSFDGSFDSVYVGPDVVSVKLVLSQYTGGAHNLTLVSGINFDRATGKQLLQQDAFKMIGLTVQQVSAQASAELKAKLGDGFQFPEGANTNPENFSSFTISADSVTFIFQEYQVAAFAAGAQEVSFPRKN